MPVLVENLLCIMWKANEPNDVQEESSSKDLTKTADKFGS